MKKCTLITAVVLTIALIAFQAGANSIVLNNPSFEQGHDHSGAAHWGGVWGWQSEYSGAGNITGQDDGWTYPDNGKRPDCDMLAFAQGTSAFYQTVSGLDTGKQYWLQVWYNVRNSSANSDIGVYERTAAQTNTLMSLSNVPAIDPGFANKLYYFTNLVFTPSATSADIVFANLKSGASTVFDGIALLQRNADEVLIINPSFEASGITTNFNIYGQVFPDKLIAGWESVSWYGIGWVGSAFNGSSTIPDGDYSLFINQGTGAKQTIEGLTSGYTYELSYYYNVRNADVDNQLQTTINGSVIHDEANITKGATYHYTNLTFVASANSTILQFNALAGDDNAVNIDNVSIKFIVPEPVTFSLIGCLAALFIARRR